MSKSYNQSTGRLLTDREAQGSEDALNGRPYKPNPQWHSKYHEAYKRGYSNICHYMPATSRL